MLRSVALRGAPVMVENPLVIADRAERAAAEAVIAATPEEVKAFAAESASS